jgi:GIY-YIG catalytic domain-containing protein
LVIAMIEAPFGAASVALTRGDDRTLTPGTTAARRAVGVGASAFVYWMEMSQPWLVESQLIASVCLPLNLDQNRGHAFHATLSSLRSAAKQRANELPAL